MDSWENIAHISTAIGVAITAISVFVGMLIYRRQVNYVTFIPYREATWRITGITRSGDAKSYLGRALATTRTFRPLTDEERHSLSEANLHLVVARRGEPLGSLSQRSGNTSSVPELAASNGLFIDHRFKGGELVKIVLESPYVPKIP